MLDFLRPIVIKCKAFLLYPHRTSLTITIMQLGIAFLQLAAVHSCLLYKFQFFSRREGFGVSGGSGIWKDPFSRSFCTMLRPG